MAGCTFLYVFFLPSHGYVCVNVCVCAQSTISVSVFDHSRWMCLPWSLKPSSMVSAGLHCTALWINPKAQSSGQGKCSSVKACSDMFGVCMAVTLRTCLSVASNLLCNHSHNITLFIILFWWLLLKIVIWSVQQWRNYIYWPWSNTFLLVQLFDNSNRKGCKWKQLNCRYCCIET